jgi:hypothetical protein
MNFFDISHLKSVNAVLMSRPKKFLRRNTRPFFTTESGKRYSANVSKSGSVAKFVSLSDNWPILVIEKSDD